MTRTLFTTVAVTMFGAAAILAGTATVSRAQDRSPNDVAALLDSAQYAQQAAPHYYRTPHQRRLERRAIIGEEPLITGSVPGVPPLTAPTPPSEEWRPCLPGADWCTAAGYPNLGYYRRLEGYPF
ncbi:hypothetical protein [Microvirga sp. TS319]|uniref:hypothetical protein n=1 Tax=Microvirga sp. TS319 TaxID=3241165 RepID=UPI00351A5290